MKKKTIIYYIARILSVLIVLFFGLFVLEGFDPMFSWQDGLWHLSLMLMVLIVSIIAWVRPTIGGWFFVALGTAAACFFHPLFWNGLMIGSMFWFTGAAFLWGNKR
jgi:hypothetical protein